MTTEKITLFIKQRAAELGFSHCGISKARRLDEEAPHLEQWLGQQYHGRMAYMENHFDKRLDPRLLVDGAKSVISLLFNYFPGDNVAYSSPLKVSNYAYGIDYHTVIKNRLFQLAADIQAEAGGINYRVFTDSAPVLDRAWAVNAGLGWIGKNSLMITRKQGSFFFIAEIICDLQLTYDNPFGGNYCGDCTRCMDACPTGAIVSPRKVDASRCISYLTIELKDEIPAHFQNKMQSWIFGCDVCQLVCPWNRFSIAHGHAEFLPRANWPQWSVKQWTELEKPVFKYIFGKSALTRAGFKKLKNNINFAVQKYE